MCGFIRVSFQLRKLSSPRLMPNAVTPRAYMSSLSTTEAFQKSESSKAYGSEQIQVFVWVNSFLDFIVYIGNLMKPVECRLEVVDVIVLKNFWVLCHKVICWILYNILYISCHFLWIALSNMLWKWHRFVIVIV